MATKPKAAAPAVAPGSPVQVIKVVPKRAGFRRAGREFPDGETVIALSELTQEQFEALTSEPMLVTTLVELPAEAAATAN